MTDLISHFEQFIKVSPKLKDELLERCQEVNFQKGALIHHADKICTKSYFIQKGLARLYFLRDNKQITDYFCSEGDWVNSPRSMMLQTKDIYFIDAVENIKAFELNLTDLGFLFDNFPEMSSFSRFSMNSLLFQIMERIHSIRCVTAKEKYNHFRQTYSHIHPRIPLGMVASYLGITQETLSRIRAQR